MSSICQCPLFNFLGYVIVGGLGVLYIFIYIKKTCEGSGFLVMSAHCCTCSLNVRTFKILKIAMLSKIYQVVPEHFNLYLSCFCPFSDVISLIVTLVAVSMLWSIFRLIRVASRVGGFNAFVSILDLDDVLQPASSLVFCWPNLPFPQQSQYRMRISWCQGLSSLDTSCIFSCPDHLTRLYSNWP